VSNLIGGRYSIDRIKKEIKKCDVLCSNCHREEHFILKNGYYTTV